MQLQPDKVITITSAVDGPVLRVCVEDTGPGIEPAAMETLFEAGRSTKNGSMGVGLSISRTIVEAHGGHLTGRNLASGGALFCFTIPVPGTEGPSVT